MTPRRSDERTLRRTRPDIPNLVPWRSSLAVRSPACLVATILLYAASAPSGTLFFPFAPACTGISPFSSLSL